MMTLIAVPELVFENPEWPWEAPGEDLEDGPVRAVSAVLGPSGTLPWGVLFLTRDLPCRGSISSLGWFEL